MVTRTLTHFAATVAFALYVALLFAEYLRPGFVSTSMNVHALWLVILPLTLLAPHTDSPSKQSILHRTGLVIIGIVLALIVWHLGGVFGAMRFWLAGAAALLPLALSSLHRS